MSISTRTSSRIPLLLSIAIALVACQAVTETEEPIDWKVSWQPATTHVDNTPIAAQPTYELEMADSASEQGPWKVVWTGHTTTAQFKGPPGHLCFRAVTIENGVRSAPSETNCATKRTGDDSIRQAERDK